MRPIHVAQLLLLSLVWGGAYLFMRSSAPDFGPVPMIFLRMALASLLVLLPLLWWRGTLGQLRTHARPLAVFGIVFTAVPFLGLGWSIQHIPAGLMAVLQATAPLFSAIVARAWFGERIGPARSLGLLVGFAGVALLVGDVAGVRDQAGLAVLATLAVTALWGVSSNYARLRFATVDPMVQAGGSLAIAALVLAPLAWATWPARAPGAVAWAEVVFLGVASSGLGFLLYFGLVRSVGAVRATSVTFLNPVVATASAAVYLGEPVTARMVAAGAVILLGTALALGLLPRRRTARTG